MKTLLNRLGAYLTAPARSALEDEVAWEVRLARLWYGHLRELNPDAEKEHARRQWVLFAWELAAFAAWGGFVVWLCLR